MAANFLTIATGIAFAGVTERGTLESMHDVKVPYPKKRRCGGVEASPINLPT